MRKLQLLSPVLAASLIYAIAQAYCLGVALREKVFVVESGIAAPSVGLQIPVAYFFGSVAIVGLFLFLIPLRVLKRVLKLLFSLLFAWGAFVVSGLFLPAYAAIIIAVGITTAWYFQPRLWLHTILLTSALVSVGEVFGFILVPWVAVTLMVILSVYDVLAVRFGYMLWMARKMSESDALPAYVLPVRGQNWNYSLKSTGFQSVFHGEKAEREFSILGGGDIGFPLLLSVSIFFTYGIGSAVIVAVCSLAGLMAAYWFQSAVLKGKPMPALPPITLFSVIGWAIVAFLI